VRGRWPAAADGWLGSLGCGEVDGSADLQGAKLQLHRPRVRDDLTQLPAGGLKVGCAVAMTRGRESNTAYLYERRAAETEHEQPQPDRLHVACRGTSRDAADLTRNIIATRDQRARTAHDIAASTDREQLPGRVRSLLVDRRAHAVHARRSAYRNWQDETLDLQIERQRWTDQYLSRDRDRDQGLDYGLEM